MKNKIQIALLLFLGSLQITQAQITKIETFLTGTKVTFYINECGNTIPQAQGKLSFCDNANNLGVVERSYGLNSRGVKNMLSNHYNEDEVYITTQGISIRNEDGTWENIPNFAIPLLGTTYLPTIQNGLLLPDNKLIIQALNSLLYIYDRTTKTFTPVNFTNNRYPQQFIYDVDRNLTWILARGTSNTAHLYTYDGTSLIEIVNLGNISLSSNSTSLIYKDDHIYLGNYAGLYKIDVSNYTTSVPVTHFNDTTTPSLPFQSVSDLQFDSNGDLWLANNATYDGGLVKFNITTHTYDLFQTQRPDNTAINIRFRKFAIDETGLIWTIGTNYNGLIKLTVSGTTPTWTFLPKTDLITFGVPITYIPNHIYFRNNKFYFTTSDGSSLDNDNYEVIINDNNVWSGRNDNELGNLSKRMNSRFTNSLPDDNGGVWWFNSYDDIVVYRDNQDNHQAIQLDHGYYNQAIDVDNKAIIKGGTPNEIRKIDFPNAISIQNTINQATVMQQVGNKTWIYDKSVPKIDIYQNGILINTHTLDETDYQYCYYMAVDDDGNPWFMRYIGGNQLEIKKFDITTATTTNYNRPESLGLLKKIIAAPNNAIWIIGVSGVMYIENGNFHTFLVANHIELSNISDAVVDTNGKLHFVSTNTNSGAIGSIENPTDSNPIIIKHYITGNYGSPLLSSFNSSTLSLITIDSEGSLWSFAGNAKGAIKLIDDDFAVEYGRQAYTASTTKEILKSAITIYPNPTNGLVTITSKEKINKIEVYSVLGKKVSEIINSKTIDLHELNTGVYLVKIKTNDKVIIKRIIKN